MKVLVALSLFVLSVLAQATTVINDDGSTVEVPDNMEVRLVPAGTPITLIAVEGVKTVPVEEVPPDCIEPGNGPTFSPQPPPCED